MADRLIKQAAKKLRTLKQSPYNFCPFHCFCNSRITAKSFDTFFHSQTELIRTLKIKDIILNTYFSHLVKNEDSLCRSSQLIWLFNPKYISSLSISCPQFTGCILTDCKLTSSYYSSSYAFPHKKPTTQADQGSVFRTHSLLGLKKQGIFLLPPPSLLTVGLLDVFCNY